MSNRGLEQLRGDALAALVRRDDEAHDRADIARRLPGNALELRLRGGVTPADDATEAVGDEAVRLGGPQELAARGAVLLLGPGLVIVDKPLHTEATRPVGVVRIRYHVELVHHRAVLLWRNRAHRDV